jgi:hypothetical protein
MWSNLTLWLFEKQDFIFFRTVGEVARSTPIMRACMQHCRAASTWNWMEPQEVNIIAWRMYAVPCGTYNWRTVAHARTVCTLALRAPYYWCMRQRAQIFFSGLAVAGLKATVVTNNTTTSKDGSEVSSLVLGSTEYMCVWHMHAHRPIRAYG